MHLIRLGIFRCVAIGPPEVTKRSTILRCYIQLMEHPLYICGNCEVVHSESIRITPMSVLVFSGHHNN